MNKQTKQKLPIPGNLYRCTVNIGYPETFLLKNEIVLILSHKFIRPFKFWETIVLSKKKIQKIEYAPKYWINSVLTKEV